MLNDSKSLSHTPVLASELVSLFSEEKPPQKILDCSFGRGGHSLAFLKSFPQAQITALDCDDQAIEWGQSLKAAKEGKIKLLRRSFHNFHPIQGEKYDLILMDLGPSSPQLLDKKRGFSLYQEGPLDMRMDLSRQFKAENIINNWGRRDLARLFQDYGEIKKPYKIIEAILKQRRKKLFKSTKELARLIQKLSPRRKGKHPATLWFLALRMKVNNELEGLKACLPDFEPCLKEEGFFAIISFHSLEDRIVKKAFCRFVEEGKGRLWNKNVIRPSLEEKRNNPNSRSAKLRVFQKSCDF